MRAFERGLHCGWCNSYPQGAAIVGVAVGRFGGSVYHVDDGYTIGSIMTDRLAEIRARWEATTQKRWYTTKEPHANARSEPPDDAVRLIGPQRRSVSRSKYYWIPDAEFIVHAHEWDIPWLIEQCEMQRGIAVSLTRAQLAAESELEQAKRLLIDAMGQVDKMEGMLIAGAARIEELEAQA